MSRAVVRDERGAILVLGLFVAALLVGFLYYVIGIGDALHHTERMQDAADTGAYSTAVMHARGMNLVALLNMVQLSVVATVSALIAVIAAALATIAWISSNYYRLIAFGWTIPFLIVVIADAGSAYSSASSSVDTILRASDRAQRVLIDQLPYVASLRANEQAGDHYAPPARAAFSFPLRSMAVEDGNVFDLCLRAYPYAYGTALLALRDVPTSTVRGNAQGYAAAFVPVACLAQGVAAKRVPSDARLGGEPFQLRVSVIGDPLSTLGESGVKTATWRYDEGGGRIGALRDALSRVKLAQAEYYFDGWEGHSEMLWHMDWRARMRRYRAEPADYATFGAECGALAGDPALCAELTALLPTLGGSFAH